MPDLWAYAVGNVGGGADSLPDGWLRYVDPSEDTNRARGPVNSAWEVVQAPFALMSENIDAPGAPVAAPPVALTPFIRKRKYEVNVGRAVAAFAGYASTTEAYRRIEYDKLGVQRDAEPDISDTFHFIFNEVQAYLEEKSKKKKNADFLSQVRKKEAVYHLAAVAAS